MAVVVAAGPAFADVPEGWGEPEPVDRLWAMGLLVGAPLGLFALITLLVYLPSMRRGNRYEPGLAWRSEPEWFGGPSGGVDAADRAGSRPAGQDADRGGASARW